MTALPSKLANLVRAEFEDTCKRRFFFGLAFEPYGGTAGLYDLGPPMCAMKANLLAFWRQHFVLEENMCEVDTTNLTPEEVFIASGHVERFNDVMVRDSVTGECIRADKLVEEYCEKMIEDAKVGDEKKHQYKLLHNQAGGMKKDELAVVIEQHQLKSSKGNPLSVPFPFNLMFRSSIGPEGLKVGYMRPELAQGIILNFRRLMDSGNAQRMPFAGACIGTAFRNEIAPRACLIRVREFTLAEIEHFVNPNDKRHTKYNSIKGVQFFAWSRDRQLAGLEPLLITIDEAVHAKMIDNETVAYFLARTQQFMLGVGARFIRFRQHHKDEMAHYAQDCWDCELLTSYGWVECVGIADRSAYDLTMHSEKSGKDLVAREEFAEPVMVRTLHRKINKGAAGKKYGKETGNVLDFVNSLPEDAAVSLGEQLKAGAVSITTKAGIVVELDADIVQFEFKNEKISGRNYIPNVIEPSFGIGRILYSILEQSYWVRRDDSGKNEKRAVFSLAPIVAPQKVAILPLMVKPVLEELSEQLRKALVSVGLSVRTDDSGAAIGKKYARVDELGIPFCITLDFIGDSCVTLRERDSAMQVRIPSNEVVEVVAALCRSISPVSWENVTLKFPEQKAKE